ncbi:glucuronyl esterase domain-containing protein [Sorangium sp. So ce1153]|uniref:glucuronyl esterase domain-containing protein n=1 Tax=Sorangium sp. So ce1153 TaxID=3133333 RepID=UPI003F610D21
MLAALPWALAACGTGGGPDPIGSGGSTAVGTGGAGVGGTGTGGAPAVTAGASSSSGAPTGTGGDLATSVASTGGGGPVGTGGAPGTGGADGSGGGGGDAASAEWGQVENPGAGCTVGPMPSVASLTANAKLPDPFKKMDGNRIADKSEWACRREEILQQAYKFIYGDKPVPAEGAVSGTVSESRITVEVNDGGSTSFNLTVNMNGATAPAPAIIGYGGLSGMPVPRGVATITFTAVESTGGSGAKNGPFYSVYGSDHPAGYLTAQAWQISRVLDVLEQNPGVIDPHRVGVTGCSRWGKGAFVAGALDNRIALTIPVESGLGGTVGLRLVEVLDSYSGAEWPYHGVSYVRWLSEVALGQFTTGNSAGADNTNKLPVDMHEMMGLIAPRGLYIVDNPSTMYNGLDRNSAWVTANVGKMIFEALGVGDHMAYTGAGGSHCSWRSQYTASLNAMVDRFLLGNDAAATGNFATDLPNKPNHMDHIDWTPPTLTGEL